MRPIKTARKLWKKRRLIRLAVVLATTGAGAAALKAIFAAIEQARPYIDRIFGMF